MVTSRIWFTAAQKAELGSDGRTGKAYATEVEVLRRLRNGGQQFVRVEHVHVNDGGQAPHRQCEKIRCVARDTASLGTSLFAAQSPDTQFDMIDANFMPLALIGTGSV